MLIVVISLLDFVFVLMMMQNERCDVIHHYTIVKGAARENSRYTILTVEEQSFAVLTKKRVTLSKSVERFSIGVGVGTVSLEFSFVLLMKVVVRTCCRLYVCVVFSCIFFEASNKHDSIRFSHETATRKFTS